jgi:hypothetical protein
MATNQVALFDPKAAVPAFARKAELSDLAKSLAGGAGGKRISIKGGVFRLIDGGQEIAQIENRYLDVVIVNAAQKIGRTYYEGKYKEDAVTAPSCWSADGEKPDASVQFPQCKTCAACPQNVKGSGDNDSRACRFSQRLAVVLANDIEGSVMQLQVPAKSLFGKDEGGNLPLQAYAKWLAAQSVNPDMVITRLKFDTKAESPKLYFKAMRWLEQSEYEEAQRQSKTPDAISAITMTVAQTDHVKEAEPEEEDEPAPPPAKAAKAKPAPQAAPADDDEDDAPPPPPKAKPKAKPKAVETEQEEEPAEPVKRNGKTKEVATPAPTSSKLAGLVQDWSDED